MPPVSSRTIIRSSPSTISRLRLEASASASKTTAGRKLANRSISLRSRKMPRSGRSSNGRLSHFAPPTAPNSTASLATAAAIVSSVSGTPCSSSAAPPTRPSVTSKLAIWRRSKNSTRRNACRMISGPMPSPASTRTLRFDPRVSATSGSALRHTELPRAREPRLLFIGADIRRLLLGEPDIVQPVQQAVLAKRVDLEMDFFAIRARDRLGLQVDGHDRVRALLGIFHQLFDDLLRQRDRQDAVLEAVVVKDVGKGGRDDTADPEIVQRPGSVLAARTAAEILCADQDFGIAVGRLIEHEVGVLRAVRAKADLLKQPLRQAGPLDGL